MATQRSAAKPLAERRSRIKELKAEAERLAAEQERLVADNNELSAALDEFERSLPQPKKTGAPAKWCGPDGWFLIKRVAEVRAAQNCTAAHALRLMANDEGAPWQDYNVRTLQVRLREAQKFWDHWLIRERQLDARNEQIAAAWAKWHAECIISAAKVEHFRLVTKTPPK